MEDTTGRDNERVPQLSPECEGGNHAGCDEAACDFACECGCHPEAQAAPTTLLLESPEVVEAEATRCTEAVAATLCSAPIDCAICNEGGGRLTADAYRCRSCGVVATVVP